MKIVALIVLGWSVILITQSKKVLPASIFQGFDQSSSSSCSNAVECSLGLFCTNETCKCGHYHYPRNIIRCNEDKRTSAVLDCYCATFNENQNVTEVGACFYNCFNFRTKSVDSIYHQLSGYAEQRNPICMLFNRTGTLCGRCLPEHYPLAYSFNLTCIKCPHVGWNWGRYLMAAYLPLTLFYFFIVFFRINVLISHWHPVIWYSQAISIPALSRIILAAVQSRSSYVFLTKLLLSLYGIWNLDFFRPFYSDICLGIGLLPTLALDYAIAMYPLFLMAITYLLVNLYDKNYRIIVIMWRPFKVLLSLFKKKLNIRTSLIDSFATFFLLSNVKFLSVTFDLLAPALLYHLHQDSSNHTIVLYYSGDMEYFGNEHLPYSILAIVVFLVFVALPLSLLALYPFTFFQKLLNYIPIRWHILHTFMDSFTGCYKDGTEPGTRDCRWFAAVFFVVRFLGFLIYGFTKTSAFFPFGSTLIMLLILLIINIQPFKSHVAHYSKINITLFTFLSLFYITASGLDIAIIKLVHFISVYFVLFIITGTFPLFYASMIFFFWIFSKRRLGLRLTQRIRMWKKG